MEAIQLRRKQKVYYLHYDRLYQGGEFYPMIRLAGKYLKRFNFNIGDHIEIDVTTDRIEIRKVVPDAPPINEN